MGLSQFLNSVTRIVRAEQVGTVRGITRHVGWQFRRLTRAFPVELELSKSRLRAEEPSGVAALVNALGMYDYNNMNLMQRALREPGGIFLDVGANIGSYTLVASETGCPVMALEPHPKTFRLLTENISLNGRANVRPINLAASDGPGEVVFTDGSDPGLNHIVGDGENVPQAIRVPATTLDALCIELGLWPTVVKIDVEGHEPEVLAGFEMGLKHAELLIIENGEREAIRDAVGSRGFEGPFYYHHRSNILRRIRPPVSEDSVFVRRPVGDGGAPWGIADKAIE